MSTRGITSLMKKEKVNAMNNLKVASWIFKGIIIVNFFSKLSESTFYKEICKFQ